MTRSLNTLVVKVRGTSPLLLHSPAGMTRDTVKKGQKLPSREEEAELGCYRDENGYCCLPGKAFRACIVEAAGQFREKGRSIRGRMSCIQVTPEWVTLLDPDDTPFHEYIIDERRVVIPRRGAVLRARPRFDLWAAQFTVSYDGAVISSDHILMCAEDGGARIGVGDYRGGECQGPHGRFELVESYPA